jgi:hypothetical protein
MVNKMDILDKIFLYEAIRNSLNEDSGLNKWFKEKWVDISRKTKSGGHPPCGASAGKRERKGGKRAYPKCVPAGKASRMSSKQKKSAVVRKRKYGATARGKAKMVSTYGKK